MSFVYSTCKVAPKRKGRFLRDSTASKPPREVAGEDKPILSQATLSGPMRHRPAKGHLSRMLVTWFSL